MGTPGPIGLIPPSSRLSCRDYEGDKYSNREEGNMDFNRTKAHLISQAKLIPLAKTQKELDLKKHDAAEYRKKILAQQHIKGKDNNNSLDGNKTTFSQCVFNMANILMGVGLLGLPYAFAKAGFLGGIFAILTFAIICRTSSILIGRELRMKKTIRSFPDIAREVCIFVAIIYLAFRSSMIRARDDICGVDQIQDDIVNRRIMRLTAIVISIFFFIRRSVIQVLSSLGSFYISNYLPVLLFLLYQLGTTCTNFSLRYLYRHTWCVLLLFPRYP